MSKADEVRGFVKKQRTGKFKWSCRLVRSLPLSLSLLLFVFLTSKLTGLCLLSFDEQTHRTMD